MRSLIDEIEVLEKRSLHSKTPIKGVRDELDQLANAGAELLECYARLPKSVARSTLSDNDVRRYRDDVINRADFANRITQTIYDNEVEPDRKRVEGILHNLYKSNATADQLSRATASMAKYRVAGVEFWDKKVQHHELMRSVCAATADLPSSTAEMRREEEAALRLHSGWVVNSKIMQLQARINLARTNLAQVNMAPQATMLEAPVRELLIGDNGQTRLLGNFIGEVFPAFVSTAEAVLRKEGRPLDAEHCAVLEGVVERIADFASASHAVVDRLRDHQAGAGLPLELLSRIVDDAWIASDEVTNLLALQPKPPAPELPADAAAAIPTGTAGKTMVAESTAARKKTKGKSKQAAGAGSSAAGQPEPQVAAAFSDPAPAAKVLVRTDLGTKKLVSTEEAQNSASSAAARLAILQNPTTGEDTKSLVARAEELLQFDLPAQQSLVSQACSIKPEDAEHTVDTVVQRLQTQAAEMEACLPALEASLRSMEYAAKTAEVHELTVQFKRMLGEVRGLAKTWDKKKPDMINDCMKRYAFPSQNYLEQLRSARELTPADPPCALNVKPGEPGELFEIRLQPKALSNRTLPSPMWVHIHTTRKIYAQQLATLDSAEFAACHVKSNEQRGHNRQWQTSRAKKGYDNVAIHRGKLTPAFCKSLLSDRADMRNGPA